MPEAPKCSDLINACWFDNGCRRDIFVFMYIRETKTTNRKTGTVYVKHTLVESVRTPNGPRQRTVMQLGNLSLSRRHWPSLAIELERRIAGQTEFGNLGAKLVPSILKAADEAMGNFDVRHQQKAANASDTENAEFVNINLQTATSSLSRSIGPELVAHAMWKQLGDRRCSPKTGVRWESVCSG